MREKKKRRKKNRVNTGKENMHRISFFAFNSRKQKSTMRHLAQQSDEDSGRSSDLFTHSPDAFPTAGHNDGKWQK